MKHLCIIKPDANQMAPEIIQELLNRGITIEGLKVHSISQAEAKQLYEEHEGKFFHNTLVKYMQLRPCVLLALDYEGENMLTLKKEVRKQFNHGIDTQIETLKTLLPESTDPQEFLSEVRYTLDVIHCSDNNEGHEINYFFKASEIGKIVSLEEAQTTLNETFANEAPLTDQEILALVQGKLADKAASLQGKENHGAAAGPSLFSTSIPKPSRTANSSPTFQN